MAAPVSSLIALRLGSAQDWLSLFLQRKALEEKPKIEQPGRKQYIVSPQERECRFSRSQPDTLPEGLCERKNHFAVPDVRSVGKGMLASLPQVE